MGLGLQEKKFAKVPVHSLVSLFSFVVLLSSFEHILSCTAAFYCPKIKILDKSNPIKKKKKKKRCCEVGP